MKKSAKEVWLVAGRRSPFAKVDTAFKDLGAIELSVPVVRAMVTEQSLSPDFLIWGSVAPNLGYSNIGREVVMDAGLDQRIPAFTTIMACSTSMLAAMEAASMVGEDTVALVGGVESMSRVQLGLSQNFSDWLRRLFQARSFSDKLNQLGRLKFRDIRLHIPSVSNRSTGLSMGEHSEITTQRLEIARAPQDEIALQSHQRYLQARERGFFTDLLTPVNGLDQDTIPRQDTSLEKLAKLRPVFDRTERGTHTAGNSSLLTDGAAGLWVTGAKGLDRFSEARYAVKVIDWEQAAVNIEADGLLMATTYAIPRLLARHGLKLADIDLWEIHEAFGAQVLANVQLIQDPAHLEKAGVSSNLGPFPWERLNPNGGSISIGHPFGATGARILSQAVKELAGMEKGKKAIVSVCADGGLGTVMLLEH
ncbi:thiolase family protein [Flavilitoribacter nigricans]|uniref:Acetyl-CoA C-acyltransferase n=1 Tax=Flavilitoribacter nigricans (strain ATCC 23147 / DSM 23189 / NBRC 102662 / NCIMB 1420 / SS-2) TaxID=1122177 RepID=A0A2D0N1R5_FLAN2|nr:acetyl-CoA C-acyltransferase [Flavilitoribacter nigricans]PHN02454.1 acetyl-CoA C-acyltransferase [Flavilitoribacter nigricans DSM 23189 = NBRC 102662]